MRYLVIFPCEDARSGVPFAVGDEFLPEPELDQAERLIKAGCLRVMPDDAPILPGTDEAEATILDLRSRLEHADETIGGLNDRLAESGRQQAELVDEYKALRERADVADGNLATVTGERDQLATRVTDLERELADATKLVGTGAGGEPPAKHGRKG